MVTVTATVTDDVSFFMLLVVRMSRNAAHLKYRTSFYLRERFRTIPRRTQERKAERGKAERGKAKLVGTEIVTAAAATPRPMEEQAGFTAGAAVVVEGETTAVA